MESISQLGRVAYSMGAPAGLMVGSVARVNMALRFAALGVPVFPCWWVADSGRCACSKGAECRDTGKHPIWDCAPHGLKDAATDTTVIETWWSVFPGANPAGRLGLETGLFAVDIDPRNGGDESIEHLQMALGPLPNGPRVSTGGGGEHYYFKHPGGAEISFDPDALAKLGFPGIDIKADGGYVMLPGSNHKSGGVYLEQAGSEFGEVELPEAPAWLLDMICRVDSGQVVEAGRVSGLPVSARTREFLAGGAELGTQRSRALAAARNLQGAGVPLAEAAEEIWRGLESSEQNPGDPWTRDGARKLTASIYSSRPPSLPGPPGGEDAHQVPKARAGSDVAIALSAPTQDEGEFSRVFKLLSLDELDQLPDKEWIFENFLGRGDLMMIYGQPGSGKTFLAIYMALLAATGDGAFAGVFSIGDPVRVIYATGEKQGGLKSRFRAARAHYGVSPEAEARVRICQKVPQLFDEKLEANVERFILELETDYPDGFDILIIDTLHGATVGSNENDAGDAGTVIHALRKVTHAIGCAVVLLHHPNRGNGGERGSGAYRAAVDEMVEVLKPLAGPREMRCEKMGDASDKFSYGFSLVEVGGSNSLALDWGGSDEVKGNNLREDVLRVLIDHEGRPMDCRHVHELLTIENVKLAACLNTLIRLVDKEGSRHSGVTKRLKDPLKIRSNTNPYVFTYRTDELEVGRSWES